MIPGHWALSTHWLLPRQQTIIPSQQYSTSLTRSLPGQIFPGCHPRWGLGFAEVPAGYLLWCRCTAELHVLNDERHLLVHVNWRDNLSEAANVLNRHYNSFCVKIIDRLTSRSEETTLRSELTVCTSTNRTLARSVMLTYVELLHSLTQVTAAPSVNARLWPWCWERTRFSSSINCFCTHQGAAQHGRCHWRPIQLETQIFVSIKPSYLLL